ncbi:unnamed protein product [Rhizoctonia solani]|uniref:C20G8.02-like WWE domain-containing protein n=1 Tax=Rhizoctonia solani TaxID=456999 RepID=A0A8H2X9Y7_9AGAM|nr:unnamed protein product [Rhizoctonia solani]
MEIDEQRPPEIFVQWYHAGPAELLSSAPVALDPTAWQTLSREESNACEAVWKTLTPEEQATAHQYIEDELDVPPLEEDDEEFLGVPVTVDKLFEINVRTMRLYPVFWKAPGPPIKVRRCVWMYDEVCLTFPYIEYSFTQPRAEQSNPLSRANSRKHISTFLFRFRYPHLTPSSQVKPYLPSYPDEVQTALSIGTLEAQDKLKIVLRKSDHSAVFQDARSARIFPGTTPPSGGLFSWGIGRGRGELFPGATSVWRGIEAAADANTGKEKQKGSTVNGRRLSISSLEETANKRQKLEVSPDASRTRRPGVHPTYSEDGIARPESRGSTKSEGDQPKTVLNVESVPENEDAVVTDLFLIIHGIGQGYTAQYEAWDFTYATNLFRDITVRVLPSRNS